MPRPRPLRHHLLRLALAGLIPTALFAGALMVLLWRQQQTQLLESLQDTARAVSLAVDREVEISVKRLEVLASQDSFRAVHWPEFSRESGRLLAAAEDWDNLLVFAADGAELINIRADAHRPLPEFDDVAYIKQVAGEGSPVVSDLFVSPTTGEQVVHVAIPARADDGRVYVLAASLDLSGFDRLLADQSVRAEGLAGVFDRDLRYIARNRDSATYLGARPIEQLRERFARREAGVGRFPTYDTPEIYAAWTRSALTGWTVTFGVPVAPVETSLRSSLELLAGVGVVVVLVTVLVALHLGRQLTGNIAAATASAMALAKGEPPPKLAAGVTEIDVLSSALERTAGILAHESRERARVERERGLLLEREQQARREAEAAGRAKDEFFAMLGHELRNPLAPILFAVELAKAQPGAPTRELEIIERQARHIERLVNDLLDVARIIQGKISLTKRLEEVQPIVAKAVEIAAPLFETKQHVLRLEVPRAGLCVEADETRLAQVIANLLTNAAKFTDAGGEITVTAAREGDEVVIRVRDTGVGIAPELLPQIFDIFTQGKRGDETTQGLGLGLALVRSFVQLHGGTVTASSEGLGHGSEFCVRLPAVDVPAHSQPEPARERDEARASPARILVVDDNVDAADTLASLLAVHGYEVRTAYDGRRAIEVARSFTPAVAIVDIAMPVIDGYQVAQELSRAAERPYLIAVTGYGQDHDRARSHAAGFDTHLVKPVAPAQLLAQLAQVLEG